MIFRFLWWFFITPFLIINVYYSNKSLNCLQYFCLNKKCSWVLCYVDEFWVWRMADHSMMRNISSMLLLLEILISPYGRRLKCLYRDLLAKYLPLVINAHMRLTFQVLLNKYAQSIHESTRTLLTFWKTLHAFIF